MGVINYNFSGNFLTRQASKFASGLLPSKLKQLIFVTSGLAVLIRDRVPDLNFLGRVNSRLKSGYSTAYMVIPAYTSTNLWKGITTTLGMVCPSITLPSCKLSELTDGEFWRIGMVFATKCPEWLKYGSMELMASDIHDALEFVSRSKLH